jgi:hypothetical protein
MDAHRIDGSHHKKLLDRRPQLVKVLHDPTASGSDKKMAKDLLIDIQDSLASCP